jgi:chromate transport protein ChrA
MLEVYGWLIAFVIIGIQFYFSRRTNVFLGAILPGLYLVFIVSWFLKKLGEVDTLSLILAAVGGLAFLLSIWINGRESLKKKRKKELEKIDIQNIQ